MGHDNDPAALFRHLDEGRSGAVDACRVGDVVAIEGNIKVNPDKDCLIAKVEVVDGLEIGQRLIGFLGSRRAAFG
jgi:hypothetical protein